jgi:uncharacterized protein YegP (UPF0339 family)
MNKTIRTARIYRDRSRQWRWTLFAQNGRKLANSGEGYKRRSHCRRMVENLFPNALVVT